MANYETIWEHSIAQHRLHYPPRLFFVKPWKEYVRKEEEEDLLLLLLPLPPEFPTKNNCRSQATLILKAQGCECRRRGGLSRSIKMTWCLYQEFKSRRRQRQRHHSSLFKRAHVVPFFSFFSTVDVKVTNIPRSFLSSLFLLLLLLLQLLLLRSSLRLFQSRTMINGRKTTPTPQRRRRCRHCRLSNPLKTPPSFCRLL